MKRSHPYNVDVDKGARRALVQTSEGPYMTRLQFEWDEEKATSNLRKHGVSFEECITVFGDPQTLTIFDEEHSDQEDRYIDMGRSAIGRVLVVVYTERGESIRIISCRRATSAERRQYEQQDL
jgi:uncharacterized DUF497 family protein